MKQLNVVERIKIQPSDAILAFKASQVAGIGLAVRVIVVFTPSTLDSAH